MPMLTCLILGDSIALGIAAALGALNAAGCDVRAKNGASIRAIIAMTPSTEFHDIIVSAGSNDDEGPNLVKDLTRLRSGLRNARVIWIYPRSAVRAWTVYRVARRYADRTVDLHQLHSWDGVHPSDYDAAARLAFAKPRSAAPGLATVFRAR